MGRLTLVQLEQVHVPLVLVDDLTSSALLDRDNLASILTNDVVLGNVLACVQTEAMDFRLAEERLLWDSTLNAHIRATIFQHVFVVTVDRVKDLCGSACFTQVCVAFSRELDAKAPLCATYALAG
jgi:hypothetical protein